LKAIVMAGGGGTRLRPLTCDLPKPMVPVINRPMLAYTLELLAKHGFSEIGVTLQYQPEDIKDCFGDGSDYGVKLRYFIEDSPLGTAGSVKNAADFLDDTFIVISGDALTDFDLTKAVEFHRREGGLATLVLTRVENPLEYGVVIADNRGRVRRFLEKPGWGEVFSDTVNTGIYVLEPRVLDDIPTDQMFDFSKDLFPLLLERGEPLLAHVAEGYWCDIGGLEQYRGAHIDVLEGRLSLNLKEKELSQGIYIGRDVQVDPTARIYPPVVIGAGCRVGAEVVLDSYTVLGPNTEVQDGASVKRGITWSHTFIGKRASLHGGIVCRNARLGKRVEVYENAVIGDGVVVEEQAVIKPGVKVWPEKVVESGARLCHSLVWGERVSRGLFSRHGVAGVVNRDLTPEVAARLGGAFGSLLAGKSAVLASDHWPASRMLKDALATGMQSAGVRVLAGGDLPLSVLREAVAELKTGGGAHVHFDRQGETVITFVDKEGLNISRGEERKVEQLYFREDFHRVPGEEINSPKSVSGLVANYRSRLINQLDLDSLSRYGFKVVLGCPPPLIQSILLPLLQGAGATVVTLHAPMNGDSAGKWEQAVIEAVSRERADLGAIVDANAETLLLFDEQGRPIGNHLYTALTALLVLEANQGGRVAVPVTASSAIDELASVYQAEVRRVKTTPRALMEALKREARQNQGALNQYLLSFDAVEALLRIMEYMAQRSLKLSQLVDKLPLLRRQEREVAVAWGEKGRVMRRLIEESEKQERELVDGLRVRHGKGWATILPDPERPSYHIYSEGYNEEYARSLADFYEERVRYLRGNGVKSNS